MMLLEGTIFKRNSVSRKPSSRYAFLLAHYKKGNLLDIGNIGGLEGGKDGSNSSHLRLIHNVIDTEVYGFDLYEPTHNRELYKNQSTGDIHKGLPYEDNFFDTIYMGELIEHLHNPGIVLSEIHRVLKNDGVFILDTPNAYSLERFVRYFIKGRENLGDPTHIIMYTPASLCAILEKTGFSVSQVSEKVNPFLKLVPCMQGMGSTLLIVASKRI